METFLTAQQWVMAVLITWVLCGFMVISEKEQAVAVILGWKLAVLKSGLKWWPFYPIGWVTKYQLKMVELNFARRDERGNIVYENGRPLSAGGFVTARGETGEGEKKREITPLNVGVTLSFRFFWPREKEYLFKCVELLPSPNDEPGLTSIFQEIVMDETRSVGCQRDYIKLMSDRASFAKDILEATKKQEAGAKLIVDTGLVEPKVVIDHIDLPEEMLKAIDDEEASRLKAEGVRRKAEGDRDKKTLEGQGDAAAEKAVLDARTAGLKNMMSELGVKGEVVMGSETARAIAASQNQKIIIAGSGGFADLVGVAVATGEALKSQASQERS